jgi:hypothetical protein
MAIAGSLQPMGVWAIIRVPAPILDTVLDYELFDTIATESAPPVSGLNFSIMLLGDIDVQGKKNG